MLNFLILTKRLENSSADTEKVTRPRILRITVHLPYILHFLLIRRFPSRSALSTKSKRIEKVGLRVPFDDNKNRECSLPTEPCVLSSRMASFLPTLAPADVQRAARVRARSFPTLRRFIRYFQRSSFRNRMTLRPPTAFRRTSSIVSRTSCSSFNASGRPGASLYPSSSSMPTRMYSFLARTRLRSRSHAIG
jgi:hypothetical protein